MNIAVPYDDGKIHQFFDHCTTFLVCDVEEACIKDSKMVQTDKNGRGILSGILSGQAIDVYICDEISAGALASLNAAGVHVEHGKKGNVTTAADSYLKKLG